MFTSCRYVIVLSSLVVVSFHLAAQGTIRGAVTEADQRPASDAIVHLSGTTLGARSDSSGLFRVLRVPAGSYTLRVAKLGLRPDSAPVAVPYAPPVPHAGRMRDPARGLP